MAGTFLRDQMGQGTPQLVYDYPNGAKQTMDGSAKTFGPFANGVDIVRVDNTGAVDVWARADGTAAVAAAAACIRVRAGIEEFIPLAPGVLTLSIIGASGDVLVMPPRVS
jgi:hypothetical protein